MNKTFCRTSLAIVPGILCASAWADEPQIRHGVVSERHSSAQVEGGFTATYQDSSDSRISSEGLISVDLVAEMPVSKGILTTYVEGNISPRNNGVSTGIDGVNDDAGSALDRDGKGRMQLSGIHYTQKFGANSLTVGLLDPDCRLDSSWVANDETRQFLAGPFVNNPTIAFPDYTLGDCMHVERGLNRPGLNLLLTSSHGLGDNPNTSYSELVDIGANGKGVFIGTELYWQNERSIWRLGLWSNTADNEYVDGSGRAEENYGAYLSSDHDMGVYRVNFRIGVANDEVSEARNFVSMAVETDAYDGVTGFAAGRTGVSDKVPNVRKDDSYHSEVYFRFDINDNIEVTPSLQWIKNSGLESGSENLDDELFVYSVRMSYLFQ